MLRSILAISATLGLMAAAATAQTYSVEPGQWQVEGSGNFAGSDFPLEAIECVSPEQAQVDIDAVLAEAGLGECVYDIKNAVGNRSDFSLSCVGDATFNASGVISVERTEVSIKADGAMLVEGIGDVPASIDVTATRTGSCSN